MDSIRRRIIVTLCLAQLIASGCAPGNALRRKQPMTLLYREIQPQSLSDYIKAVYKVSNQAGTQDTEARDRVLKENPDLAKLVARIANDPGDIDSKRIVGMQYLEHQLHWYAYEILTELEPRLPNDRDIQLGLARIWDAWKEYDLARQHAELAIRIDPNFAPAYDELGRIQLHENKPELAIESFSKAVELDSQNPLPLANSGYAHMLQSDWVAAKKQLELALELDPTLVEAINNLAIVLSRTGDYDGALQQLLRTAPPAAAMNNLGVLYLEQDMPLEARESFRQSLKLDPDYERARTNLQRTLPEMPLPFANLPLEKEEETPTPSTSPTSDSGPVTVAASPVRPQVTKPLAEPSKPADQPNEIVAGSVSHIDGQQDSSLVSSAKSQHSSSGFWSTTLTEDPIAIGLFSLILMLLAGIGFRFLRVGSRHIERLILARRIRLLGSSH